MIEYGIRGTAVISAPRVVRIVQLIFGQTGNIFIKDGKEYKIRNRTDQMVQALKSGLHYPPVDIDKEVEAIYARKAAMKEAFEAKRKTKEEDRFYC